MRLGIVDHHLFVRKHFPNEKLLFLPSFAVGPNVIDSVEAAVEEAIATGSMVDIMVSVMVEYIPWKLDVCLSVHRYICVEKKNQLDVTECFIACIICSTCFGHLYAHHQEPETVCVCVLLLPMVCNALVAGGRTSGAGQQAMRPE